MSELIDREAAIKATWQEPSYTAPMNVLTEVRDRIKAIPAAMRWVRVEDELPYKNTNVLLYDEHGYYHNGIMSRFRGYTEFIDYDGNTLHGITHWMPIEPPKEDMDGERREG